MESSEEYFAVFFTTSGAIRFHRFLRNNTIPAEVKPVPRNLSTSCAIGIEFFYKGNLSLLIIQDIKQIYIKQGNQYILKYAKGH
ncbi:DUF3343 domain-containing protein [Desulfosporosinus hippei]|uniref:Putative Se/S carrier protein-like domain-containing protein n=1 Tax=Desulfosporosinus hippei DSM 8344 TaxID=1121419 RepID=A0A1G8GR94_9FIRM|nr:DUF3343 domain-containing protein [Desulfosporosinus hippei]SDH96853.1 Protein of unknown function [Desulfosporosinus hippei DSM 8344]